MKAVFVATVLLAVVGCTMSQGLPAELAPQSVNKQTGEKFWKDPVVAARANNLTTFAAGLRTTGLDVILAAKGFNGTVFVPSNAAFANVTDPKLAAIVKNNLADLLKYHVAAGANLGATRLTSLIQADPSGTKALPSMLIGSKLNLTLVDGKVNVNGIPLTGASYQGANTRLHVIDAVLIPDALLNPTAAPAAASGSSAPVIESTGAAAPAATGGAASVAAASMLLAAPAILAALL